jgi:glutamate 5-kinase
MGLVQAYESCFSDHGLRTAQILLTHEDLADRERYLNDRSTLMTLISLGIVPIINENDTVVTDEIKFGDNDTLGALVANLVEADWLVILTDIDGLFDDDPRKNPGARLISKAHASDIQLESMAGGAGSTVGKGGMITKVRAARRAARSGADTFIVSGEIKNILLKLIDGQPIGTHLRADTTPITARKQWLANHIQVSGKIVIDTGAVQALRQNGKSLLPVGATAVEGDFERGAVVTCVAQDGTEIARGLINYGAKESRRIIGKSSADLGIILGYLGDPELIHRNNLVLM